MEKFQTDLKIDVESRPLHSLKDAGGAARQEHPDMAADPSIEIFEKAVDIVRSSAETVKSKFSGDCGP
jgi:hypothetical protein